MGTSQTSSKSRKKLNERIARLHQKVSRQRRQWHFETAQLLLNKADTVFIEDLKVGNMARKNKPKQADDGTYLPNGQSAKSGLNKSFADAGISGFLNDELIPQINLDALLLFTRQQYLIISTISL